MRQLQLAILNYESAYGHFPSDTIQVNANGQEIRTSWRVHILPFIEHQSDFNAYRFDEPWNSPGNRAVQQNLTGTWFGWFNCPSNETGNKTPYKLIVGKGTAFEQGKQIGFADCEDGSANIVTLVEDCKDPVEFFEPRDLSPAKAVVLFNSSSRENCAHFRESLFTKRYHGFNIALLDGSVRTWPSNPDKKIDEGAFLIADGILFDSTIRGEPVVDLLWGRIVSLVIYILLCIYPVVWIRR